MPGIICIAPYAGYDVPAGISGTPPAAVDDQLAQALTITAAIP